ncbi:hypothetical protein HYR99_18500 [Candidatus Poribacteria bacterium]|nr:hypothetical protein [Candidatus Poribacteria bacterium]
MLKQPSLVIGLCIGILATIIFVLLHLLKGVNFFKKNPPNLVQAITLILSCTGVIAGFDFGRVALFAERTQLGPGSDGDWRSGTSVGFCAKDY